MTVGVDRAVVETALLGGELGCPALGCAGWLAPWGWAGGRIVRGEAGDVRLRPRRARCGECRGTHVLLPVSVLLRRADEVTVIGAALLAKAGGCGHRRIAARLGLPASMVRGWLRRIGVVAGAVLAAELGGEFVVPAPAVGPVAAVVELVGALAGAVVRRLGGSCAPWRLAVVVCGGRLLSPGPFGVPVRVSRASLDRWIRAYRTGGFTALVPVPRRLAQQTPPEVLELAVGLKREAPGRTAAQVAAVLAAHAGWAPSARTLAAALRRVGADPGPPRRDRAGGVRPVRGRGAQRALGR